MKRERILLLVLGALVIGIALLFLSSGKGLLPSFGGSSLAHSVQEKEDAVALLQKKKRSWDQYRGLSLPGGTTQAQRKAAVEEYQKYLGDLLARCDFSLESKISSSAAEPVSLGGTSSQRKEKAPYYKTAVTINAKGDLKAVTRFLEEFYKAPRLQQFRSFAVHKPDTQRSVRGKAAASAGSLEMQAVVEALILDGADERTKGLDPEWFRITDATLKGLKEAGLSDELKGKLISLKDRTFDSEDKYLKALKSRLPEETLTKLHDKLLKLAVVKIEPIRQLALNDRTYKDVPEKNIFYGPKPEKTKADLPPSGRYPLRYITLSMINGDWLKTEVHFHDRASPGSAKEYVVRAGSRNDDFAIQNSEGEVVLEAHVCKVDLDKKDVYFRVDPPAKEKSSETNGQAAEAVALAQEVKLAKPAGSGKGSGDGKASGSERPVEVKKEKVDCKFYRIHVGETLEQALKTPLKEAEIKSAGLKGPEEPTQ